MRTSNFQRMLRRSASGHVIAIAVLLVWPLIYTFFLNRAEKPEKITLIDLQMAMTTPNPQVALPKDDPKPPQPDPPKPPEPQPPEPKPPEPKPPAPKPGDFAKDLAPPVKSNTLVKASDIKISTNKVKIAKADGRSNSKNTGPVLTKEQIAKLLAMGIPVGDTTSLPGGGEPSIFSAYFLMVRQVMYDAWQQPSGLAGSQLYATVRFRVMRDGAITGRTMAKSSGNSVLDASVMRAANSVSRLRPLPVGYQGNYKDITVDFELAGSF